MEHELLNEVSIIGPAIIDILAAPINEKVFTVGSLPMETIKMTFGGDALNEAFILTKLEKKVQLITKVGNDDAGKRILGFLKDNNISTDSICVETNLLTAINIVLVDEEGNRHFLTNPNSSLRKLRLEDIDCYIDKLAKIVSFAGMFISPLLTIEKMEEMFKRIKEKDRILIVDMTKAKNGETLQDIEELLPHIDYIFPNEEEIALLTGEKDPYINVKLLIERGVKTAVIKCGRSGCIVGDKNGIYTIPAVPVSKCVDSTGAGDSFVAGFIWGISNGWDNKECAKFACAVASCVVEKVGATEGIDSIEIIKERYYRMDDI